MSPVETPERTVDSTATPPNDDVGKNDSASKVNNETQTNNGVNAGQINGPVNYNNYTGSAFSKPELHDFRVSDHDLERAKNHFVPCPGYDDALATLKKSNLVLLRGKGTGRSLAAIRMLVDCGARTISQLNVRRSFDSITDEQLDSDGGFIWQGTESQWQQKIAPRTAERVATWAQRNQCYVVVIVDEVLEVGLQRFESRLGRPDSTQVAREFLRSHPDCPTDLVDTILTEDFRAHLRDDSAPNEAEFVAIRAWDVHENKRELEPALADLSREAQYLVADWFHEDRSTIEYAMLVAIAVFTNRDYGDVMSSAEELEEMIAKADEPEDKRLRQRKIFDFSKSVILSSLNATTTWHPHARGASLFRENVHFRRSDWAKWAFRRAWLEYDLFRPVIVDWMARQAKNGFQWYCAKALHDVITGLPHTDPLEHIKTLASKQSLTSNELAAELLARFADDPGTKDFVEPLLRDWCTGSGFHRKWTAALVYATEHGVRDPERAMARLEAIARSDARLVPAVKVAVTSLLSRPINRELILRALVKWTRPHGHRRDAEQLSNLRSVGLDCAQAALGLTDAKHYLQSLPKQENPILVDPHPWLVARLFWRVFLDQRTRKSSLRALLNLCEQCEKNPRSERARGLAQLVATVAPDLHRHDHHALFEDWKTEYPGNSGRVDRAFSTLQLLHQRYAYSSPRPHG
ncbi:hypothetical protein E1181_05940 [Saccharopolyspora terrae]|uniref:Uncharacterized protein n=1 Tax=Saccharopolyspora terrae TaxID=2530384 RepID=A0A4R4VZR1_9PSEU|nr:hypothetical protein [Saccharopolyspora terrae]TDD09003.1 hypothetical protein E1181_05940 [Saccharopolyspora terrae]